MSKKIKSQTPNKDRFDKLVKPDVKSLISSKAIVSSFIKSLKTKGGGKL